MWKSWWLRLQWATSPDCVTAGDQHPLGSATEEQLCRVSADSPGGRGEEEEEEQGEARQHCHLVLKGHYHNCGLVTGSTM